MKTYPLRVHWKWESFSPATAQSGSLKATATQHFGLNPAGDEFGQSPCGAYLSLAPCLCLRPTPTHKSSSSAIKALCGWREHVFFPAFTIL